MVQKCVKYVRYFVNLPRGEIRGKWPVAIVRSKQSGRE